MRSGVFLKGGNIVLRTLDAGSIGFRIWGLWLRDCGDSPFGG